MLHVQYICTICSYTSIILTVVSVHVHVKYMYRCLIAQKLAKSRCHHRILLYYSYKSIYIWGKATHTCNTNITNTRRCRYAPNLHRTPQYSCGRRPVKVWCIRIPSFLVLIHVHVFFFDIFSRLSKPI